MLTQSCVVPGWVVDSRVESSCVCCCCCCCCCCDTRTRTVVTDANCADGVEVVESSTHVGGAPALMGRPLEQGPGKAQAKNAMACAPGPWRKVAEPLPKATGPRVTRGPAAAFDVANSTPWLTASLTPDTRPPPPPTSNEIGGGCGFPGHRDIVGQENQIGCGRAWSPMMAYVGQQTLAVGDFHHRKDVQRRHHRLD